MTEEFKKDFVKITCVMLVLLVFIISMVAFNSCDSGWTIAGWEVK